MGFRKRAGAPRLIDWTGERCVPWAPDVPVVYEHFHRYLWAAALVEGRRVLDLGSGEGFGAAMLAQSAAHVVGIDIDETTVEHSTLNYAAPDLEFRLGTALDLSAFADGSLGAVVAFEVIEHVREQERVLAEIQRVLDAEGVLIISTPDRHMYGQMRNEPNPFHERELATEEFLAQLAEYFPHVAAWGQRTITGSHMNAFAGAAGEPGEARIGGDFYIERAGDEWRQAIAPAPLYCVAIASRSQLPAVAVSSTLADCGLGLLRAAESEAHDRLRAGAERLAEVERAREELLARGRAETAELASRIELERQATAQAGAQTAEVQQRLLAAHEDLRESQEALARSQQAIHELRAMLAQTQAELAGARQLSRRVEESVTWQLFQRTRGRLYRALGGERSLRARALGAMLRSFGRGLRVRRSAPPAPTAAEVAAETLELPRHAEPLVSLIIPLHAHAPLTHACLASIRDNTHGVRYEVILVDDAADPATRALLETVRGATIIRNETNLGYLRSVKRGAEAAKGEWLVLFNNDTVVMPGWLSAMLDCAGSRSDVGVVTPKFLYPDGTLNEAGGIIWRDGTGVNYGRGDAPDRPRYEYRRETDYGSAAALMVSAALWREVGGFDERYHPMYYEDTDLCFQARERGMAVLYEPRALVVHIEGATAGTDPESGHKRHQERNRKKFVARWRARLEADHRYPAPGSVRFAADRHQGPHVLVLDHRVPMWDRDSGSLRMLRILQSLIALGARVTFVPDNLAATQPYTRELQQMGIEVLYGGIDLRAELAEIGPTLQSVIVCRPHPASHWLDTIREFAPTAPVAYDTVDLHWLREARKGALADAAHGPEASVRAPNALAGKALALRELELAMIRASDTTIVVTERERAQVRRDVPDARVLVIPNVHEIEKRVAPPERRAGVLFVGSFEHTPNVDAAVRLVREVMPLVWRELGRVKVTIVGADPPPEVLALAASQVEVAGWVEDLQPLLQVSRVMVAPLRYGAGMKGKVTQCLAVGLPVVTTAIGAEGLLDADVPGDAADCLLVADDPLLLAEHTVRVHRDDELWSRLSAAGQRLVAQQCAPETLRRRLGELFAQPAPSARALDVEPATQP